MNEEKQSEIVTFNPDEKERIGQTIITAMSEHGYKDIGSALVREATKEGGKEFMQGVQNRVKEMVLHLNNLYLAKEKLDKEIAMFQKRIAAVQAGEFKVESTEAFGARLIFNDILLNF